MNDDSLRPQILSEEIETALSYYPELQEIEIDFIFKEDIKHNTMQAQPALKSFLKARSNRSYRILISEKFKISGEQFETKDLPSDVLIGWIGHELGHLMDYQNRSNADLIWFGVKYLLSDNHIVEAERAADTYAVMNGMSEYILKTKNFILNHALINPSYKERIKKYYLSPEEIVEMANQREEDSDQDS